MLRPLKSAAIYFAIVFGVGFVLGPIRILWLQPRLGARMAELIEAPFMLMAIVLAGRWVGRRLCAHDSAAARVAVGVLAAGLVLVADLAVGVGLRGMSAAEVFLGRDPVSASFYYALVGWMAVAPWAIARTLSSGTHKRA